MHLLLLSNPISCDFSATLPTETLRLFLKQLRLPNEFSNLYRDCFPCLSLTLKDQYKETPQNPMCSLNSQPSRAAFAVFVKIVKSNKVLRRQSVRPLLPGTLCI